MSVVPQCGICIISTVWRPKNFDAAPWFIKKLCTPAVTFFFNMVQQSLLPPQWAKASSLSSIHDHIQYDSSGRVLSPKQRPPPDKTQHSQKTDIHAPCRIRTHSTIPATKRPQTRALDRAATGNGTPAVPTKVYRTTKLSIFKPPHGSM